MPYTEIKKNSKGEWALFFTGWDTDVNGDGHRLGECKELIDSLAENKAPERTIVLRNFITGAVNV